VYGDSVRGGSIERLYGITRFYVDIGRNDISPDERDGTGGCDDGSILCANQRCYILNDRTGFGVAGIRNKNSND